MDKNFSENTISDSKEESIAKAIRLLQGEQSESTPLHRPKISTTKTLLLFVLWGLIICGFPFLCLHIGGVFHLPFYVSHPIATMGCLFIIAIKAKSFLRNAILLYQKHAPEKLRQSCLFVPSCSEYMLLAVDKYGFFVGLYKGLNRLSRCHHPNGGEDYP